MNLFEQVWAEQVCTYDQKHGIAWDWQILDSAIIPAPLGGAKTGKNPTDRAKWGSKRHLLVDRRGVPLALTWSGANIPDYQCAEATLLNLVIRRSWRDGMSNLVVRHFCADKFVDWGHPRKADVLAKVVGDFRGWSRSAAKYEAAFKKLLKALKAD